MKFVFAFVVAAFAWLVWQQVTSFQFFYADGVNDFFNVVTHRFNPFKLWTKWFADLLFGLPTWIVAEFFPWPSFKWLAWIFGFSLQIHFYASLVACWLVVKERKPALFVFPLLSFLVANGSSSFFIITQAHVACSFFWPLFLYLLTHEKLSNRQGVGIALYLSLVSFTYQVAAVYCVLICFYLMIRSTEATRAEWRIGLLCLMIAVALSVGIASYPQPQNRDAFFEVARLGWLSTAPLTAFLLLTGGLALATVWVDNYRGVWPRVLAGLTIATVLAYGIYPLLRPSAIEPFAHYLGRALTLHIPIVLAAAAYLFNRRNNEILSPWVKATLFAMIVSNWLVQTSFNLQWKSYYSAFRSELEMHQGLVDLEQTNLIKKDPVTNLPGKFVWSWTNPLMSVAISAASDRHINSVFRNRKGAWIFTRDHEVKKRLDLTRYGTTFEF